MANDEYQRLMNESKARPTYSGQNIGSRNSPIYECRLEILLQGRMLPVFYGRDTNAHTAKQLAEAAATKFLSDMEQA